MQEWGPFIPELLLLLPDATGLIPDFASVSSFSTLDPQKEKRRLFVAMTYFFTQM
jgi:hypothetical protein